MDALFADPRSFVSLLGLLVSIAGTIYAWVAQRNKAKADEIDALSTANSELEKRVAKIEYELEQLPNRDAVHRLEITIERISGQLDTMNERLNPIDNLSRRLQEVLLERAK